MSRRPSVVRSLLLAMLGTGLAMGLVFPPVVAPFADYRPGMRVAFSLLCVVAGLVVGGLNFLLVRVFLLRTVDRVSDQLEALARGEGMAVTRLSLDSADALGRLVSQFNGLIGRLQETLHQVIATVEDFVSHADETGKTARELVANVDRKSQVVEGTATLFGGLRRDLEAMRSVITGLQEAAGESGAAVTSQVEQVEAINRQIDQLQRRNQANAEGIGRAAGAVQLTAGSTEQVTRALEEAAASMTELDMTVREIEQSLGASASIAERVAGDAGQGDEAVRRTQEAMERIRAGVEAAAAGIAAFTAKVAEIAAIAEVIDEVTERTNLLALNAAIIAAQAGRHGRGFGVVAGQIKALADRTAASTREIGGLVGGFREQAAAALASMTQSRTLVQEGLVLSQRAGDSLGRIRENAVVSHQQVRSLDRAVREIAATSHYLSETVETIAGRAKEIAAATREQEAGLAGLGGTVQETAGVADAIAGAVRAQLAAARHIEGQMKIAGAIVRDGGATIGAIGEQTELLATTIETLQELDVRERQYFGRCEQDAERLAQEGGELRRVIVQLNPGEGDARHRGSAGAAGT